MSFQRSVNTESPNHWWASSCTMVVSLRTAKYTGLVCVSSENPAAGDVTSTIAPVSSNG